ncbi:MAG: Mov34/MPN/PAD-1 family protein [Candidatus Bathyarchaeia archaeon]|jgi:proteasome lid subunit RPN8/RPN11
MSYVSIRKPVNDRITKISTENSNEVIGLLIGSLVNDTLVIEDSITGEFSGEPHRVVLHPTTIAKIADELVKGRLKGNIIGWYHSHTEGGIFFSQTDVETQKKLQQFSSLTVGMVVDAKNGNAGFFRIDNRGKPVRVPEDNVKVYIKESEAAAIRQPPIRRRTLSTVRNPLSAKLILGVVLLILAISLSIVGIQTFSRGPPPPATIHHTPITNAIVGSSISIIANSTGIKNITLFYARDGTSFTGIEMSSIAPGEFQSIILGSQVTGNLSYYLQGATDAGTKVSTGVFHVLVSDFNWFTQNQTITVYRNATNPSFTELSLISINGFNKLVTISASGAPNGVIVSFSPDHGPPETTVNVSFAATPNASLGSFPLLISASYSPPNSQVVRTTEVMVTVTDFTFDVFPSSLSVIGGSQAAFTINVTIGQGFEAPITLTAVGLPQGAKMLLIPTDESTLLTVPGTISLAIQTAVVGQGTYTITLTVRASLHAGGYVIHSQKIQLTVS